MMHSSEVWLVNLDPTVGPEINKTRPAIIVNRDAVGRLPLRVVVPLTSWKAHYSRVPWMVRIEPTPGNGLDKVSAADAFQVRSVAEQRFVRRLGTIEENELRAVRTALSIVLQTEP